MTDETHRYDPHWTHDKPVMLCRPLHTRAHHQTLTVLGELIRDSWVTYRADGRARLLFRITHHGPEDD